MNNQIPESYSNLKNVLDVHSVFYTIQGEGPYAGHPAIFIRLAGCNLQCPNCDTDYTSKRIAYSVSELAAIVDGLGELHNCLLVVITGGEPLRQAATADLIEQLIIWGMVVQIETNGMYSIADLPEETTIVCSPKTSRIHESLLNNPTVHFKYVIREAEVDENGLPSLVLGKKVTMQKPKGMIWLQAEDEKDEEKNRKNLRYVADLCVRYGYRFSVQLHKLGGLE
jgi:7-carboxy-7-deazaguanine synthase